MFGREVGLGVEMEVGMGGPGWGVDEPPALKRGVMLDAGGYGADRDGEDEGTAVAAGLRFLRRGVAVAEEEVLLALDRDDFGFALGETDEGWRGVRGTAVRVDVVEREEEEEEVEGEGDEGRGDVPCGVGVSCGFSAVLFDIKSACCSTRNASLIFYQMQSVPSNVQFKKEQTNLSPRPIHLLLKSHELFRVFPQP